MPELVAKNVRHWMLGIIGKAVVGRLEGDECGDRP